MNLSKNFTFRTMTAAVLAVGLSLPVYAAEMTASTAVATGEPATNVVSQTTKVVTTTTTHVAKHKAHHAQSRTSKTTEVQQESAGPEKHVVWKNGVIFNDVEPTAQSQSTPFGAPISTSDTLKGGVTSTLSPVPTH